MSRTENGSQPTVSVVVPFKNGATTLPRFLAALDAQSLPLARFEVVLVDDGSTDEGPRAARAWAAARPDRRRVLVGAAEGPASARNRGIAEARGEWIASTDCDMVPAPDWLELGLAQLAETGAVALEGAITVLDGARPEGPFPQEQLNASGGRFMTGNMFYRRDIVERLGGFDERFEEQFLEDSDLGFRILEEGHEIPFAPHVRVAHPAVAYSLAQTLRSARRSQWFALFAAKHPDLYGRQLRPLVRPLPAIDVDVLLALGAAAALPRARGLAQVMLATVAVNGLKRGLAAAQVHKADDPADAAARATAALLLPPLRAGWWLAGCVRFRKLVL